MTALGIVSIAVLSQTARAADEFLAPYRAHDVAPAWQAAFADVNGDGLTDIVSTDVAFEWVTLGKAGGGFELPTGFPTSVYAYAVAVGDVNGDGKPDAVTADYYYETVSLFLGQGNGAFSYVWTYITQRFPAYLTLADVDGSGRLSAITSANTISGTISILQNDG